MVPLYAARVQGHRQVVPLRSRRYAQPDGAGRGRAGRVSIPPACCLPQCLEARLQTRPIVALAGGLVLIEVPRFDAGGEQRVTLQVESRLPSALEMRI